MKKEKKETKEVAVLPQKGLSAETLIAQAIEKNVSVETMEKLLAMRRELKAEFAKEGYYRALSNFQAEIPPIEKTKAVYTNSNALAYKYASIESIVVQVKDALQNNGFSYSTNMQLLEAGVKVFVKTTHIAGHSEITEMEVPFGTKTAMMSQSQVAAAASTFAKRYAFLNAFGILTGDEDTDGKLPPDARNGARTTQPATPTPKTSPAKPYTPTASIATKQQVDFIVGLLPKLKMTIKGLEKQIKKTLPELTAEGAKDITNQLKGLLEKVEPKVIEGEIVVPAPNNDEIGDDEIVKS